MRKTTPKKAKQSPRVANRISKPLKPASTTPTVPAGPIAFNDPFPVIHKPETTAETTAMAPDPQKETNF
jgi:hypothetical protein